MASKITLGQGSTASTDSIAIGRNAVATGSQTISIGLGAVCATDGSISMGTSALASNTTGSNHVAIGYQASAATNTDDTTAVGYQANQNGTGNDIVAIGFQALNGGGSTSVAVGSQAGFTNTGNDNICIGYQAGYTTSSGNGNVSIGTGALFSNSTSSNNTAIGFLSSVFVTSSFNTAVGDESMHFNSVGASNTSLGALAFQNGMGNNNTSVGFDASGPPSSTDNNVSVGHSSRATGGNSTVLGQGANDEGFNDTIVIGKLAAASASNQLILGTLLSTNITMMTTGTLTTTGNTPTAIATILPVNLTSITLYFEMSIRDVTTFNTGSINGIVNVSTDGSGNVTVSSIFNNNRIVSGSLSSANVTLSSPALNTLSVNVVGTADTVNWNGFIRMTQV